MLHPIPDLHFGQDSKGIASPEPVPKIKSKLIKVLELAVDFKNNLLQFFKNPSKDLTPWKKLAIKTLLTITNLLDFNGLKQRLHLYFAPTDYQNVLARAKATPTLLTDGGGFKLLPDKQAQGYLYVNDVPIRNATLPTFQIPGMVIWLTPKRYEDILNKEDGDFGPKSKSHDLLIDGCEKWTLFKIIDSIVNEMSVEQQIEIFHQMKPDWYRKDTNDHEMEENNIFKHYLLTILVLNLAPHIKSLNLPNNLAIESENYEHYFKSQYSKDSTALFDKYENLENPQIYQAFRTESSQLFQKAKEQANLQYTKDMKIVQAAGYQLVYDFMQPLGVPYTKDLATELRKSSS